MSEKYKTAERNAHMYILKKDRYTSTSENVFGGNGPITSTDIWPDGHFPKTFGKFMRHVVIPPGSTLGQHTHTGEKELYYALRGTIQALDGDKMVTLNPGDVLLTGWGEAHALYNNGTEDFEMVAIILFDEKE